MGDSAHEARIWLRNKTDQQIGDVPPILQFDSVLYPFSPGQIRAIPASAAKELRSQANRDGFERLEIVDRPSVGAGEEAPDETGPADPPPGDDARCPRFGDHGCKKSFPDRNTQQFANHMANHARQDERTAKRIEARAEAEATQLADEA